MNLMRLCVVLALAGSLAACGGDKGPNPGGPSPVETRILSLEGDLSFGDVQIGATSDRTFKIRNVGNATLTVTSLSVTSGNGSAFTANWTSGAVAPNAVQDVSLRFAPTENRSYSGVLTVTANQTSGQNTIPINARGRREIFTRSGTGNTVFDMPTDVTRVRITGFFGGFCQNFAVRIGGRLIVNEILGTCSVATTGNTYTGEHVVTGGTTEITISNGVAWTITELR